MSTPLLYGRRTSKRLSDRRRLDYQQLVSLISNDRLVWPEGYSLRRSTIDKNPSLRHPHLRFTVSTPAAKQLDGCLLIDNELPVLLFDYLADSSDNEQTLFSFLASLSGETKMMAYLNISAASGQQLSLGDGHPEIEDFTSRYRPGWKIRSSYYGDRRSEAECLSDLAHRASIDRQTKMLLVNSASLEELLSRPSGRRALNWLVWSGPLHLKRRLWELG